MGLVGVAFSVYILILSLSSVSNAQVVVQDPVDATVCKGQNAVFTCVIHFSSGVPAAPTWFRNAEVVVSDMVHHNIINNVTTPQSPANIGSTITVINVSMFDDGALYNCGILSAVTSNATLNVVDPPPINNIRVDEICSNDFTISWSSTRNDTGLRYNVILNPSGQSLITMVTYYNFTGLTPNTNYSVTVATWFGSIACLGFPMVIIITTSTRQATVPMSVSNLRTSSRTFNAITVMWDPADSPNCGPVLYYTVSIVNLADVADMNTTITSQNTVELSNLINGTSYNISVVAVNRADSGPTTSIITNTTTTRNIEDGSAPSDDDNDNTGAIIGGTIGGISFLIIISASTTITIIWWRGNRNQKGKLPSSNSSESPNATPVHDAPQYADLHHGKPGDLPPTDHSKVAYTQVKEHEPLNYAQVQHEPGSDTKPVQGAPPVEYREVWHEQ